MELQLQFDKNGFRKDVKEHREKCKLTHKELGLIVCNGSGIRIGLIEQGELPDVVTLLNLCNWMRVKIDKYLKPVNHQKGVIIRLYAFFPDDNIRTEIKFNGRHHEY